MSRYGYGKTKSSAYSKSKRESQNSQMSDNSSDDHSNRVTPHELRRPFVVFNDDANAVEDIRYRRQRL